MNTEIQKANQSEIESAKQRLIRASANLNSLKKDGESERKAARKLLDDYELKMNTAAQVYSSSYYNFKSLVGHDESLRFSIYELI